MYKSDWDLIGGFNTERYTHKWGEEDVGTWLNGEPFGWHVQFWS